MTAESDTRILDIPVLDLHDEPTVRDVDLGVRLGMKQPHGIRQTIRRHIKELQGYGAIYTMRRASVISATNIGSVTEYHLTEPQALRPAAPAAGRASPGATSTPTARTRRRSW